MKKRILIIYVAALSIGLFPFGCATGEGPQDPVNQDEMPEDFLSRPRFDKAVPRPLGRVLLKWDAVVGAAGYEIQVSLIEDFSKIEKTWTVSGKNLELPIESGDTFWFRIRSFNDKATSRWSAALEVREDSL